MKKLIVSIFVLLALLSTGRAQNFVFRVIANNGSNVFKTVSTNNWSPIERGVAFQSGDVVKIVDRAYLGLIHNSGKTVELINSGTFEIDDIELNIDARKKGIGGKYTEFVINTLDQKVEFGEKTEIVTRGGESTVHVIMPAASEVMDHLQIIRWIKASEGEDEIYLVSVKGIFDDILLEEEVDGNEYLLDLDHPSLVNDNMFVISVSLKGSNTKSREYALDRISKDEREKYLAELDQFSAGDKDLSSLDYTIMASFFEEKGLLIDASSSYQRAIKKSPEIADFQELFQLFKTRHNLDP